MITVTFLGTGTSQGVPIIACSCEVCQSNNPKDKRLRTSIMVEIAGKTIVIDAGPDFRYQMLREQVQNVDALLMTHEHNDHVAGLDDVRPFNFKHRKDMELYAEQRVLDNLQKRYDYIFASNPYPGIPKVKLHPISKETPFLVEGIDVIPIEVMHHRLPVLGFRFGDFTYITDANRIEDKELDKIRGSKVLVLNALRKEKHLSHFTLAEAVELAEELKAEQTYFVHMSHVLGTHNAINEELPNNIELAYDGLKITI